MAYNMNFNVTKDIINSGRIHQQPLFINLFLYQLFSCSLDQNEKGNAHTSLTSSVLPYLCLNLSSHLFYVALLESVFHLHSHFPPISAV